MLAAILSPAGLALSRGEAEFFRRADPWGYILMGRSCGDPAQMRALTDHLRDLAGRDLPILIDMEGGRVARMRAPVWPEFPAAAVLSAPLARSERVAFEAVFLTYLLIGLELRDAGVNVDCAPVLDVPVAGADPVIGDRAFGRDAAEAAFLGRACLDGLRAAGVAGIIKHIPGHGRAEGDSHFTLPRVRADRDTLRATDFAPFRALRDAPMAMSAHIVYEAWDSHICATHSRTVIEHVIRGEIGFDGLLMSDDLTMAALGFPESGSGAQGDNSPQGALTALAWRAERSITAGCDVVLHCAGFERDPAALLAQMEAVAEAVPTLSGMALARAERAIQSIGTPISGADRVGLRAQLDSLLAAPAFG